MFQLDTDESVPFIEQASRLCRRFLGRRIESGACAVHLFVLVRDFGKAVAGRDTRRLRDRAPCFVRNEPGFRREPSAPWRQLPARFRRSLSASENQKDCVHL